MGTDVIFGIMVAFIGFFLVRFWQLVDEMRKDIKQVLTNGAVRDQRINETKEELDEVKDDIKDIKKEVEGVQKDVIQLKTHLSLK